MLFFTNAGRSVIITSDRQAPRSQGHVKELGRSGLGSAGVEGQPREPRSPRMAGLSQAGDGGAGAGNALGRAAPREHPETQERSAAVSLGAARTILSERCPRGPLPAVGISQRANRLRVLGFCVSGRRFLLSRFLRGCVAGSRVGRALRAQALTQVCAADLVGRAGDTVH